LSLKDKVTGEWRKLRQEEIHDLYVWPGILYVIKLQRIRWAIHVARFGKINISGGFKGEI
jgi:hypothetical protein